MQSTQSHANLTKPTDIYHEVSGGGPVALLVAGTPGDCGQFDALADALGDRYTVVRYDRRGTSRSCAPEKWAETSVAEQADDAALLLSRITTDPALVYGTSNGAAVALEVALRHPERVSAALLHEMPLISVLSDPAPVHQMFGQLIGLAMEAGGPTAALDAFLRFAFGDKVIDGLDPDLRDRMYANAEMVFSIEMPAFQGYRPDEAALQGLEVPVRVLVAEDQPVPLFAEAGAWLAQRCGTQVVCGPGGHAAHLSHPTELARFISEQDPHGHQVRARP